MPPTHVAGMTPSIVTALECSGLHSTIRTRRTILANPVGTRARNVREGAQWLWPIFGREQAA